MKFLDTNILLYAVSAHPQEAKKTRKAREILQQSRLALSVQVLQEFYVQATRSTRSDPLTHEEATGLISHWLRLRVVEVTIPVLQNALRLKARYQTSYWDAAILAAAAHAGCSEILSEDLNAGQTYDSLRVVNPFM